MRTYNTKLVFENEIDKQAVIEMLEKQRLSVNAAYVMHFGSPKNSIVDLHAKFYNQFRKLYPEIPSQIVIRAEHECLSTYRTIKSNKHKITEPPIKRNLSSRLDKRLYTIKNDSIRLTTLSKRVVATWKKYKKLCEMFQHPHGDPLIFVKDNEVWISFTFEELCKETSDKKLAVGVDLGIRRVAATSEGIIFKSNAYNGRKRKTRHLKRQLQSKVTRSAKRKLKKVRNKERNQTRNQTHLVANAILRSVYPKVNVIVLEDLKGIKKKKNKFQSKNRISQVPFFMLRQFLEYKARSLGMSVETVSPRDTSQIDHVTQKKNGRRQGCRYYSKSGLIYDAEINAAINIAIRSNHPISRCQTSTYGQVLVSTP